ncbi:unnamed protein product (macronuclear) [Paramecium tetraurelia]|uniref:Uncharacterized protein n=1 Tax=Paramecium tetraurelia TaxID=5888 RepID=A0BLJ7_PARTE|nr:uncharacterized protein GSPATT00030047001 [Paramecium tetraurelia]CAK59414.1 unnamed protein product [Paramecium tetraurelia]|eukprot:XP_001426812.1 hypothetical protein (macronuclear) [Paramecium tetraurelia strain d4-2]
MIIHKGNKIQIDNHHEDLDQEVFSICQTHKCFYRSFCTFCDPEKDPEEFYCQSSQEKPVNYFVMDIEEASYFDNQYFNAGISSYDQLIHKDKIAELQKNKANDPKDIAIQLGLYTKQDVKQLIDKAVLDNWQEQQEFSVTVDFWEISKTKTFINRAEQILEDLNLQNSIIIFPAKKSILIKVSELYQQQNSKFLASYQIIDKQAGLLKAETAQIAKKDSLPDYDDQKAQYKRILNVLLKPTQQFPFPGEIVYFVDQYKDIYAPAQKFGKQQTQLNIYCNPKDVNKYYNTAGVTGGKVHEYSSQEKRQITLKLRAIISNNFIFTETQSDRFEKFFTEINFPFDLEYELRDPRNHDTFGCLQVIIQDENGCFIEQKILEMGSNNDLHEPSVSLSEETLNLTIFSKE